MIKYSMYKVRYGMLMLDPNHPSSNERSTCWFLDFRTWSRRRAMREYGNAMIVMTHLDIIEIWKFNWRKWEWELLDRFERGEK